MAPIYKVYVNGIVEFITDEHNKFNDTVGYYIDQFYESGFTMVSSNGDVYDMHYVFYNFETRCSGSVGYELK